MVKEGISCLNGKCHRVSIVPLQQSGKKHPPYLKHSCSLLIQGHKLFEQIFVIGCPGLFTALRQVSTYHQWDLSPKSRVASAHECASEMAKQSHPMPASPKLTQIQ